MAEAAVTFALEQLRDLLYEEGRLLSGVGGEVKELEKQLLEMKCLIKDADKRRHESDTVKNFIVEIRDLADRAEDAIELYAVRVSSKRRRGVKKVLRRYACILKECHSLHQLDSEISDIKSGLARVIKKMQDYGIIKKIVDGGESSATSDNQNWASKTYPDFEIGDCFVGMEKELKQLVVLIEGKEHRIISVWGMGGLGKTTIARKLYNQMKNHPNPASCFDRFAWVCISQQCQIHSVLEDVLKQLDPQRSENASSLQQMVEQLIKIQRAHRCLIVIDDLWNISHWNEFKHAFLVEDLQNKVLVTTRKQNVADMINGFSVKHGNLNMDEAWELLKKKAFPDNNIPDQEMLYGIGEKMLGKCGCLPLAICVLGGVLRKKSIDDWESVHENMNEYMCKAEGDGEDDEYQIRGVLDLSYEELPYYLKPCFLYLGTLKEDEIVSVLVLYRLWIAQGMISSATHGGKQGSLMDIAEIYLSELVSRCVVEVEVEDITAKGKYRKCKLHDVVREQCLLKGRKEGFGVTFLKLPGGDHGTSLLRYLVIHIAGEVEGVDELSKEDTNKLHVRSLKLVAEYRTAFPAQRIFDFQRFKMLRDLVIVRFKFPGRKFPRGIFTNLVHLRCLRLLRCKELDELPSSISKLVYLETLDLSESSDVRILNVLKKMLKLKHLILPQYDEDDIGSYRLRLDEGLDELETLMWFDSRVHELKCITRMKNLRRLSAFVHDNKSLSVIINALDTNWNKLQLSAVLIRQGCELTGEEGLMMLKQLFRRRNLHYLVINVELEKLPVESMNDMISSKLGVLRLENCEIEDDPMGILGKLPFLSHLYLSIQSFVGEELTCTASSFPRLKTLEFLMLPKLREWRLEAGAMPLLSELYMDYCRDLEKVPDGLSSIYTLQKLEIQDMPELARRVAPSGEDFAKVSHIPSIIIRN